MLTHEEEQYILTQAYVPEHVVGLMTYLSGGEPFLIENFLCCQKNDWIIVVGYPLEKDFNSTDFEGIVENIKNQFRPKNISIIAPEILPSLLETCTAKQSDTYYTLDADHVSLRSVVRRNLKKAQMNIVFLVRFAQLDQLIQQKIRSPDDIIFLTITSDNII